MGIKPVFNIGESFVFDYDYELFSELYFSYQKKAMEADLSVIGGKNVSSSKFLRIKIDIYILFIKIIQYQPRKSQF